VSRDVLKMVLATVFLVGAVGLLAFQIAGRAHRSANAGGDAAAPAEMLESSGGGPETFVVEWEMPEETLTASLAENPFLRPAGVARKSRGTSGRRAPTLTGVRTGKPASVVINDRILTEGEAIAGWRVLSVEWDRVTLRSSDGKTIHLTAK